MHREYLVEPVVRVGNALALCAPQLHSADSQVLRIASLCQPQHHIRMVDAPDEAVRDGLCRPPQSCTVTEADLENVVARLQFQQIEGDPVSIHGLVRHDPRDDLAQPATRTPTLPGDEFGPTHRGAPLSTSARSWSLMVARRSSSPFAKSAS